MEHMAPAQTAATSLQVRLGLLVAIITCNLTMTIFAQMLARQHLVSPLYLQGINGNFLGSSQDFIDKFTTTFTASRARHTEFSEGGITRHNNFLRNKILLHETRLL